MPRPFPLLPAAAVAVLCLSVAPAPAAHACVGEQTRPELSIPADGATGVPTDVVPVVQFVADPADQLHEYAIELRHGGDVVTTTRATWLDPGDGWYTANRWVRLLPAEPLLAGESYTLAAVPADGEPVDLPSLEATFTVGNGAADPIDAAPAITEATRGSSTPADSECDYTTWHALSFDVDVEAAPLSMLHVYTAEADGSAAARWRTAEVPAGGGTLSLEFVVEEIPGERLLPCFYAAQLDAAGGESPASALVCPDDPDAPTGGCQCRLASGGAAVAPWLAALTLLGALVARRRRGR